MSEILLELGEATHDWRGAETTYRNTLRRAATVFAELSPEQRKPYERALRLNPDVRDDLGLHQLAEDYGLDPHLLWRVAHNGSQREMGGGQSDA